VIGWNQAVVIGDAGCHGKSGCAGYRANAGSDDAAA
jgi:hypothetical protein